MTNLLRAVAIVSIPATLTLSDSGKADNRGQTVLSYEFRLHNEVLFAGSDFAGSPLHADDSDETVASLLGFLTLRPGDTDSEYFDGYNEAQRAWSESSDCEQLQCDLAMLESHSGEFGDAAPDCVFVDIHA